jgi:hypothetical protein
MDSFEFNKIAAAILIALLTIKGADLISNHLIEPHMLKENVYKIAGVSASSTGAPMEAEKKGPAPIEPLLAAANVQQGEVQTFMVSLERLRESIQVMLTLRPWRKKGAHGLLMT